MSRDGLRFAFDASRTGVGALARDAAIFVDGVYVGTANDFSAMRPPLSLAAGRHHFELRAQGYQTMAFDVEVRADWVVPYQGVLQPQP